MLPTDTDAGDIDATSAADSDLTIRSDAVRPRPAPTRRDVWRRVEPIISSNLFIGVVLAVFTWPGPPSIAVTGVDAGWQASLAMAANRGMHFGTQVVWTYGPLGFVTLRTLYFTAGALLAFVFQFALAAAVMAVIVSALRRHMSLALAIAVAYVAGYPIVAMTPGADAVLVLALVLCVRLLSRPDDAWRARWLWGAFGATAGFLMLVKVSLGLGAVALAAVAVACAPVVRRRVAAGVTAATCFVAFVIGWFGTGNGVGNIVAYVRGAREASVGYTAMSLDPGVQPRDVWLALIIGAVIVAGSCVYARNLSSRGAPEVEPDAEAVAVEGAAMITRLTAVGVVVAPALVWWMLFKEGFVRQDGHRIVFFAALPLIVAAFVVGMPAVSRRGADVARTRRPGPLIAAVMWSAVVAFSVAGIVPNPLVDPTVSFTSLKTTVQTLASSSRRHAVLAAGYTSLQQQYAIPPAMLARMAGQTVDVDSIEQSVAWAYPSMRWDPLPTLQDYFAYTPALDRLDVRYLNSAKAPRYILRQIPNSIDGRVPVFDAPSAQVAIECNYREVEVNTAWQLLEKGANRCGEMRELSRVSAKFDEPVKVPTPGRAKIVVATFALHLPLWWHALDTLYKSPPIYIAVNGNTDIFDTGHPNRFVAATAPDLHVLKTAATVGYHQAFVPPRIGTLALMSNKAAHWTYTVTFYEIPVR